MNVDNKATKAKIGWYNLPADFKYLDIKYLQSLKDKSFEDRICDLYNRFTGKNLSKIAFSNVSESEFPASVISVDDTISVLELFDGNNANYKDYFFDNSSLLGQVVSLAITLISSYVDLFDSGIIELGEKINVAVDLTDGRWLLALYLLKQVKLPIETVIFGVKTPVEDIIKGLSFQMVLQGECEQITRAFYEETDYVLDPISASGMVACDLFYSDYDDDNITLLISLVSPFLFARNVLKSVENINEISVDKAISKLSLLTALDIPKTIENKTIFPFYSVESDFSIKDALKIIKLFNIV